MGIETRNGLLIDVVTSYIPSQKAVRDAVKNGRLPLWNRFHIAFGRQAEKRNAGLVGGRPGFVGSQVTPQEWCFASSFLLPLSKPRATRDHWRWAQGQVHAEGEQVRNEDPTRNPGR